EEVRTVFVVVLDLERLDGFLDGLDLDLRPSLDQDPLRVAVPAEGQRASPEDLVERLIQGLLVLVDGALGVFDDALAVELDQELSEALGEGGDLGLLDDDAHDSTRCAGLEEERAAPGLADGPRRKPVGV